MEAVGVKIREWRAKPGLFVREVLRVEQVDAWQDEVLEAATVHRRIALKASKGPGKSTVLAWLMWWFLITRAHPKVVATSITGDNLKDGLWTELSKWQQRSELLKATFNWSADRVVSKHHPETWWASGRAWAKSANPAQQADTLAGIHADAVMFVLDESGGIPDAVMAAAEAGLANADKEAGREALLVQAGNPTELNGALYRACTRERSLWWVKEISGDPDDPKRAPRVSIEWAREQIRKYGRDSPYVLVNVFGKFPPSQSNALLGVDECVEASRRELHESVFRDEVKILGVDVARFGDDQTVLFLRQGPVAFKPVCFRGLDLMQIVGQVSRVMVSHKPDAVFVDATGLGSGVIDRLNQLGYGVIGVHNGSKAMDSTAFVDRRAECWWRMASWLKAGGCIPDDAELVADLVAPTYWFEAENRLRLESKKELKKRGLPSPDKADALALTWADVVAPKAMREMHGQESRAALDYDPYNEREA